MALIPNLSILPPQQLELWQEIDSTPDHFTLYGGTALALRLGHRASVDFDFFSNHPFTSEQLARSIPYLADAEYVQIAPNTLTCRLDRGGPVLVSFFGDLGLGQVAYREQIKDRKIYVASLLDIAGTKAAVVQQRADAKDYIDIDAIMQTGIDLAAMLAAGKIIYGKTFNPLLTLKALSYFDDVPELSSAIKNRLIDAVKKTDLERLPVLEPFQSRNRHSGGGFQP